MLVRHVVANDPLAQGFDFIAHTHARLKGFFARVKRRRFHEPARGIATKPGKPSMRASQARRLG